MSDISSSTQTTQDSWESRIQFTAQILGLTPEEVVESLASDEIGIDKEPLGLEMLSDENILRFADFSKVFRDGKGVKMGKIRLAYNKLIKPNGQSEKATKLDARTLELKEKFGYKVKMADAKNEDLLDFYDTARPNDPVTRTLHGRYGDTPVIALDPDTGEVAIAESLDVMTDVDRGIEPPDTILVNDVLVRLVAIGIQPDLELDEDPLFPGQPLRRDRSSENHISWKGINHEVRQFCRIIHEQDEIDRHNRLALASFIDIAKKGFIALKDIYPESNLIFRDRRKVGELPRLKVLLDGSNRKQSPFKISGNRKF